jgi:hypothetical protein
VKVELFVDICRTGYRAVLEMAAQAIELCTDELWVERTDEPAFWQQAYHALMYIDFYGGESPDAFRPPEFAQDKAEDLGLVPTVAPTKAQVRLYLRQVGSRIETTLDGSSAAQLEGTNAFGWTGPTAAHRHIYNIRHAQHHVGRLNSILARRAGRAASWVIAARDPGR